MTKCDPKTDIELTLRQRISSKTLKVNQVLIQSKEQRQIREQMRMIRLYKYLCYNHKHEALQKINCLTEHFAPLLL